MRNHKVISSIIIENRDIINKQLEGATDPNEEESVCIYTGLFNTCTRYNVSGRYAKSQSIYMTTVFLSWLCTYTSIKSGGMKLYFYRHNGN